jgi:hypothetical protein
MADMIISLDGNHINKTKEELSVLVDQEVEKFSNYMATLGDWRSAGPLNPMERTLVKTYIITKIKGLY